MSETKQPLLHVENLKQYFRISRKSVTKAVDGISFDIYEGDQVKEGYKSIAYALSFRDMNKTLSDDEVGAAMKKILNGLQSMDIELRS